MSGRITSAFFLLWSLIGVVAAQAAPFQTEIVVRTVANLRTRADVVALVDEAVRHGVSVINLAAKQDEDDEIASGLVFYASRIAPIAPAYRTFDVLGDTIAEAHRRGVRVRAWVPQFHDQMAVRAHPEWQMQAFDGQQAAAYLGKGRPEYFVNPLNLAAQDYQRSLLVEIARNYAVDGIVLDWVRFDNYNMDLSEATRARFRDVNGYDPIEIDFSTENTRRTQWNSWRGAEIGRYVQSVRTAIDGVRPGLALGAYILPPAFAEAGQDAATFAGAVTFLSPMAYYKDWDLPPDWTVRELLPQTMARAPGVALVPVLDEDWSDAAAGEILPQVRRVMPVVSALSWFVYGKWTKAAFERIARLRAFESPTLGPR